MAFDTAVLEWMQTFLRCPFLDWLMPRVTALGNGSRLWIALGILLLLGKKTRLAGFGVLLSLLFAFALGDLFLKPLVGRPRPFEGAGILDLLIPPPRGYSFPSGHTTMAFAAAFFLWKKEKKIGRWAVAAAALIAFSRLYLFVHYPSDVGGGILLGLLCASAAFWVTEQKRKKK